MRRPYSRIMKKRYYTLAIIAALLPIKQACLGDENTPSLKYEIKITDQPAITQLVKEQPDLQRRAVHNPMPTVPHGQVLATLTPSPMPTPPKEEIQKSKQDGHKTNINTASIEELDKLPGIGPVTAKIIINGRPYSRPEKLQAVISRKQYSLIYDLIKTKD